MNDTGLRSVEIDDSPLYFSPSIILGVVRTAERN